MLSDSQQRDFDKVWDRLLGLYPEEKNIVEINGGEYALLDNDVLEELQMEFARFFNTAPMLVRDSARHRYWLGPSKEFEQCKMLQIPGGDAVLIDPDSPIDLALNLKDASPVQQFPRLDCDGEIFMGKKGKIPRPPNAFILYRKDMHPVVKDANPGIHNNDISVILGAQWSGESAAVRASYKKLADKMKQEHLLKNPGYTYQPRKPSEKKRRMTKKKAAALAAATPSFQLASQYPQTPPQGQALQYTGYSLKAQLPVSQALVNSVKVHNASAPATVPTGNSFNFGPAPDYEQAHSNDHAVRIHAFSEFLRTGLFDPKNPALLAYISENVESEPYNVIEATDEDDFMTVTPGAYIFNSERPIATGWES